MRIKHGMRFVVLAIWVLLPLPFAQAHAVLVFSNPAVNARLSTLPKMVEVEFDANLISLGGAKTDSLVVLDPQGKEIEAGVSKVSGPILTVGLIDTKATGKFTVSWRVVSNDGHPVEGSYQFWVGKVSSDVPPKASDVSPSPTSVPTAHKDGENFWIHHRSHILLLMLSIVAIAIWARFDRLARKDRGRSGESGRR